MTFPIKPLNKIVRVIDYAMIPLMFILGGFKRDAIQETHPWHSWKKFDRNKINQKLAVIHDGTDRMTFHRRFLFLFHVPVLGGWKKYSVLSATNHKGTFYIGWVVFDNDRLAYQGIHRLPIKNRAVRLLDGPPNFHGYYFAIDSTGTPIPLEKIGSGVLGDRKYPGVRLF